FFGYNESFAGEDGLENFKAELQAFIRHSKKQKYNGETAPQLALISPIAFQDLSDRYDLPDGKQENKNLKLYTQAMREVAHDNEMLFIDVFTPTLEWFSRDKELTLDGFQLSDKGYRKFAKLLADEIFGIKKP